GQWSDEFKEGAPHGVCSMAAIPDGKMVLDIGPQSIVLLQQRLGFAKTIVWNGPLGAFEIKPFNEGTKALADFVVGRTKVGEITSVAGGGDTVAALEQAGAADRLTYVSSA